MGRSACGISAMAFGISALSTDKRFGTAKPVQRDELSGCFARNESRELKPEID
ncbi:MAG: hypothetical protein R2764_10655 [Bacteroidales bacterium]